MNKIISRFADLLKIKSIITIMVAAVFVVLAINGGLGNDNVMLIIGMVFTYFFNKDVSDSSAKSSDKSSKKDE